MQEFVKYNGELTEAARSKVRNYENLEAVNCAVASGELQPGDLFTTVCTTGAICDDIAHEVYYMKSLIPTDAVPVNNMLVTQNQIDSLSAGSVTSLTIDGATVLPTDNNIDLGNRVTCEDYSTDQTAVYTCIGTVESDIYTCIGNVESAKVTCTDYNTKMTSVDTDLAARVTCTDYNTKMTSVDTDLAARVTCTDYNTKMSSLDTAINSKVDKVVGKGLSANDFTDAYKTKLDGIEAGAQVNTITCVSGRTGNVTNDQIRSDMCEMTGASSSSAGVKGLVPAPAASEATKFLKGNGTWADVMEITNTSNATCVGYVILANGLKMQWGYCSPASGSLPDDSGISVVFPIPYETAGFVTVSPYDTDNSGKKSIYIEGGTSAPDGQTPLLKTGFFLRNTDNDIKGFFWQAIGF